MLKRLATALPAFALLAHLEESRWLNDFYTTFPLQRNTHPD
jgi:hypothetical protein